MYICVYEEEELERERERKEEKKKKKSSCLSLISSCEVGAIKAAVP